MKITTFNPLIITKDPEAAIQLFEALGFERHHTKEDIGVNHTTDVRMKDANGFYVDVAEGDGEWTMIRMNVDYFDEAIEFLTARGFRKPRHEAASRRWTRALPGLHCWWPLRGTSWRFPSTSSKYYRRIGL